MRILYLYAHPQPESFHAAIRAVAVAALEAGGHEVDLLDLYAEKFDPVLSVEDRGIYHDLAQNRRGIESHVERLYAAEGLVVQFPTWSFGPPAILKGYFDRMMKPGVAFDLSNPARTRPLLHNIRHIQGIVTYGQPRLRAFFVGDTPRNLVKRYLRWFAHPAARVRYHALYHMNIATAAQRNAFVESVRAELSRL